MGASRVAAYKGLLVALCVTAALQAILIARSPTITADGIVFINIARQLPDHAVDTFRQQDQHPGYPAMLLGATRLVQALGIQAEPDCWIWGGQIISFVCGLMSVAMVWLIGRELFDARAANLGALFFAVLPVARGNASDAVSDTPHLAFYLLAAWLITVGIARGNLLWLAAAAAASGLAYWIRPEGLEIVVVGCLFVVIHARRMHWSFGRAALAGTVLAGTALVVALPYLVLAGKLTSKQLTFAKHEPSLMHIERLAQMEVPAEPTGVASPPVVAPPAAVPPSGVPDAPPAAASAPPAVATVAPATVAPAPASPAAIVKPRYSAALVAKLLGQGLVALANAFFQGFKWVFLPLYLIGHLELARRRPNWLQVRYMVYLGSLHCSILLAVFVISGYIGTRHLLPLVALAMPCAALGVLYLAEIIVRRYQTRPAFAVSVLGGLACAIVLPYTLKPFNREFTPVIDAAHWVERQAEPGAGIVTNSPYVGFHGKLPVSQLGNYASTIDEALARGKPDVRYEYIVLHVNAHGYRPKWIEQLTPRYRQIHEFADPNTGGRAKKVLVFESQEALARRPAPDQRS